MSRISPKHAFVVAQFHFVLATFGRQGVFRSEEARQVATEWLSELRMALNESVICDGPRSHRCCARIPPLAPADVVVALMNARKKS
jgi:hypothetical protein